MRRYRGLSLAVFGLLFVATVLWSMTLPEAQSARATFVAAHLPASQSGSDRKLTLDTLVTSASKHAGRTALDLGVDVSSIGQSSFNVSDQEFFVYSAGDFFGPPSGSPL